MAILKCKCCGTCFNSVLPECYICHANFSTADVIDENGSLHDGTGSDEFEIISKDDVIIFKRNSLKYGIASSFRNIVSFQYDEYDFIDNPMIMGFSRVRKDDLWGIVNRKGVMIVPLMFDRIWKLKESYIDRVRLEKGGTWYIVDVVKLNESGTWNIVKAGIIGDRQQSTEVESYRDENYGSLIDDVYGIGRNPYYNDALDIDQQSPEFWNSI